MAKVSRLRSTIGGLMLVVALAALAIYALMPSQTRVSDVKVGSGAVAKRGDHLVVHYVGKLGDGTVFDSSKARGTPIDFDLGRGVVIPGWEVGMVGMQVGEVRRLVIPPSEGYGARGIPPTIPPNSTLDFEVELLEIR